MFVKIILIKQRGEKMKEIDTEEIYHLMDLLLMNTNNTSKSLLLNDEQKKESISYDTDLIAKLESFLNEKSK